MAAIGSLVFCTDCGNLLDSNIGRKAYIECDICGTQNKGETADHSTLLPKAAAQDKAKIEPVREEAGKTALAAGEVLPEEAVKVEQAAPQAVHPAISRHPETWTGSWEAALESLQDLFSERMIQVKKVDLTTVALQGAATGFAAMGILFVMFRPR